MADDCPSNAVILNYLKERLAKLESEMDLVKTHLNTFQISMGILDDLVERQKKMEDQFTQLTSKFAVFETKFALIESSQTEIKRLLWGVLLSLVSGVGTIIFEFYKHSLGH